MRAEERDASQCVEQVMAVHDEWKRSVELVYY